MVCQEGTEFLKTRGTSFLLYGIMRKRRRYHDVFRKLTFAKDRYREKGVASVLLVTDQANMASRGLIEQLGGQLIALEEIDHLEKSLQSARYQLRTEN